MSAKRVIVGMSGGVDSSVAAALLVEQGYDVTGVYMKNWSRDLPGMKCPWAEDLADAKRIAVRLKIPFEVWDFEEAYREKVVEYMLSEFRAGKTPNPDIMCNQEIKFKLFYERAMAMGADLIATGHYARTAQLDSASELAIEGLDGYGDNEYAPKKEQGKFTALLRAIDENKDQTYFLYRISQEALEHTLFPVGEMMKPAVKELAAKMRLHNAYKKESMGVCFVGEVGMKDFLKEYIDVQPGEIREIETEKVLGVHEGAIFYTIGQRHGLYLSGVAGEISDGMPYYVVKKDLVNNIVYVSKNLNSENIWTRELKLRDVVWRIKGSGVASLEKSARQLNVLARLRHRAELVPATLDGKTLRFKQEVKRPAAGQSAVLYMGEVCVGGGIIE